MTAVLPFPPIPRDGREEAIWRQLKRFPYFKLEGEVGDVDVVYPYGTVERYGAKGDGTTDDTTALQNCADSVIALGGGVMEFGKGKTYRVSTIKVTAGLWVRLNGSTVKLLDGLGDFARVFNTVITGDATYYYTGTNDSRPLIIENGTIDGNRSGQGTYTGYEKEHDACIALGAQSTSTGKLVAVLNNLTLVDSAGDGLQLTYNCDLTWSNVRGRDNFRGTLTISGGGHRINIDGFENTGATHDYAVNIEPTATPGTAIYGSMRNVLINKNLDINFQNCPGTIFDFDNVQMLGRGTTDGGFNVYAPDITTQITFRNSTLCTLVGNTGSGANRFGDIGQLTFERCTLIALSDGVASTGYCQYWIPTTGFGSQRITYRDCAFTSVGWAGGDTVSGFIVSQIKDVDDFTIVYDGCTWDATLDFAHFQRGGKTTFINPTFNCTTALHVTGAVGTDANTITFNGFTGKTGLTLISQAASNVPVDFRFVPAIIDGGDGTNGAGWNVLGFTGFTNVSVTRGRRELYVTAAPSGGALLGDVAWLINPTSGNPNSWVATTNSNTAATWKVQTTLA